MGKMMDAFVDYFAPEMSQANQLRKISEQQQKSITPIRAMARAEGAIANYEFENGIELDADEFDQMRAGYLVALAEFMDVKSNV